MAASLGAHIWNEIGRRENGQQQQWKLASVKLQPSSVGQAEVVNGKSS